MATEREMGGALAKPKKEKKTEKKSEGEGESKPKKKVHHIEVHPSKSGGGHIAIHKHEMPEGGEPMPEDEMHSVPQGGMDEHLAAHMPGGGGEEAPAEPEPEPEGGAGGGEGEEPEPAA